jgi:hypothetical protein
MKMVSRCQKTIAVALLLLNVSGARVIAVSDACQHSRSYFGPTVGFKAIARLVTGQGWRRSAPRSLGAQANRHSSRDLKTIQRSNVVVPVAILPPVDITLVAQRSPSRPSYAWRLPRDNSPAPPSQLQSKN